MPVFALSEELGFPDPNLAREDGLLAVGGDLSEQRLIHAYCMGIFPWYNEGEPILWWSPDPRLVLLPSRFHASKSLKKLLRQQRFAVTLDAAFEDVVRLCAVEGSGREGGTWILPEMQEAYARLHILGLAHSVEVWKNGDLAGGLYGVSLGRAFFGESMFFREANASKVALSTLVEFLTVRRFDFIDCQVATTHMMGLGAENTPRAVFLDMLRDSLRRPTLRGAWRLDRT